MDANQIFLFANFGRLDKLLKSYEVIIANAVVGKLEGPPFF